MYQRKSIQFIFLERMCTFIEDQTLYTKIQVHI